MALVTAAGMADRAEARAETMGGEETVVAAVSVGAAAVVVLVEAATAMGEAAGVGWDHLVADMAHRQGAHAELSRGQA